jgi:hypothetical protein
MTVERSDRTFVSGRWVGWMVGDDAVEVMLRWCIVYDDGCMISFHCCVIVVVSIVSIVSACRVSCIVYRVRIFQVFFLFFAGFGLGFGTDFRFIS